MTPGPGRPAYSRILPFLVLLALPAACAFRLVLDPSALLVDGDRPSLDEAQKIEAPTVGNDLTRLFLPHHAAIAGRIARTGHLPRWDPRGFGGRPAVGNPQGGLFYPPAWAAWRFWTPAALGWLTLAHLAWGGFGVSTLVRVLGCGHLASTIAGGCFSICPYALGHTFAGHYPHTWAASWYPWAFLAAWRMRRGCRWGGLALPPILALTAVAGHPQPGYYLVIALAAWALADAYRAGRDRDWAKALRGLATWGAVGLTTLGFVAVEAAPDLAARGPGLRGGRMGLDDAGRYHLNPSNLLQLLSPRALGAPTDYFGHDNAWEAQLGLGWLPLALALAALALSPRRDLVRGWGTLLGACLVFAAGWRLGLFALLYQILPGMNRFRAPARALFLANLAASILAGLGVEALAHGRGADWTAWARRHRRGLVALAILILVGQALAPQAARLAPEVSNLVRPAHRHRPANHHRELAIWTQAAARLARDPVLPLALAGTAGALAWLRRWPSDRPRVAAALGILALAELTAHGAILLKTAPAARFLQPDDLDAAIARARPPGPFRVRAKDTAYDDLRAARSGVEKTNINDVFQVQHAADLYQSLYPIFDPPGRATLVPPEIRRAVLDRMGVALLITDQPDPAAPWPVAASGTAAGAPFTIYRNPTALPRAYVVPRAKVAPDDDQALARLAATDPRAAVLLPADPLAGAHGPRQPFTPASYQADDPDRVAVIVTTAAPGLLVVADTWMPGWSARLDGHHVPLLRGDHAHRVVALPTAGHHRLVMTYRPPRASLGLTITAATAAGWGLTAGALALSMAWSRSAARRPARQLVGPPRRRPAPYPIG